MSNVDPNAPTMSFPSPAHSHGRPGPARWTVPVLVAAAVAVALGAYGRIHDPAGTAFNLAGFSSTGAVKSWLATAAFAFALAQVVSALALYGRLPGVRTAPWMSATHRWSGGIAFLLAVPVAVHCLYGLGFQSFGSRVMWHSLAGCFFFGAFKGEDAAAAGGATARVAAAGRRRPGPHRPCGGLADVRPVVLPHLRRHHVTR
ncbi:hypothetical protein HNQ79_003014 [Streptomyces candidus]|uniref:Uncharacterized protein n=1 Tax=Streptomyces candidus TaxID=67283 RepID=A0A7X0HF92_9ACTN|nr:hypothetical protein [Streptomyces candidus]